MKSELCELEVAMHHETELAVLVSLDGDKDEAVWLPKSQIEIEYQDGFLILTLPKWLAHDKGLI